MPKADISLKLKDPGKSYKSGEPVDIIVEFQSNKVFKDAEIKIAFNGTKDNQKLFGVNKILSVNKWNNKESINHLHEIQFNIASPCDITLPNNGVYTVEAKLKVVTGNLWESSKAKARISIPLASN